MWSVPTLPQVKGDDGVSPVIGMILVLALSVMGIVVTLYWGMPAIDDMKGSVEYKAMSAQFGDLLREMQDLVTGTASKTSKRWDPTLNRGTLNVEERTQRWIYMVDQRNETRIYLRSVMDDDNKFEARLLDNATWTDGSDKLYVTAARISQGHEFTLTVTKTVGNTTMPATGVSLNKSEWLNLSLFDTTGQALSFSGNVIKVVLTRYDGSAYTTVATFWSMDAGSIHYTLPGGSTTKEIHATNGAILLGNTNDLYVSNEPPIDPPTRAHDATLRFFARAIQVVGSGSFAGEGKFSIVLNLNSTASLSLDTTAYGARFYIEATDASDAWRKYFTDENNGYGMRYCNDAEATKTCTAGRFADGNTNYVEYWPTNGTAFKFNLLHSSVTVGGA